MMLVFFEMKTVPFTREIHANDLFVSSNQTEVSARLDYAVRHRQFCLLTGEAGTGKSRHYRNEWTQFIIDTCTFAILHSRQIYSTEKYF